MWEWVTGGTRGQGGVSVSLMSDGRVPEHSGLCRVRGRADLFGPAAFPPAWEEVRTVLLALTPLLVPVIVPVRRRRPLQRSLQVRVLPGADLHTEGAFPLNLFEHGGVSTDPGHLGQLKKKNNNKYMHYMKVTQNDPDIKVSNTP